VTIWTHWLIDAFAFVIVALMPVFTTRLSLADWEVNLLFATGSIGSGAIQPIAAWLSDRLDSRLYGAVGLLISGSCVAMFGFAGSFWQLWALHAVSTIGIGAFHPVAAAAVGQLSGRKRSLGLAVFFLAGMLGGVTGNTLSPEWVKLFGHTAQGMSVDAGLRSLGWLALAGVAGFLAITWAIRSIPHRAHDGHERHMTLSAAAKRSRWFAVGVLYVANALRFVVNMALVKLYVAWAAAHTLRQAGVVDMSDELSVKASTLNGYLQGAMQVGMGGAGITAGFLLTARHEKKALILVPAIGALAVGAFPYVSAMGGELAAPWIGLGLAIAAGMGFGGMIPVTLSLSQRLLPHRTGLASGLMLGGAWVWGALGPFAASGLRDGLGLRGAFVAIGGVLLAAGLVAGVLPSRTLNDAAG
jgi:FSR family fosmidomycin resistance protein-like MFS transporter